MFLLNYTYQKETDFADIIDLFQNLNGEALNMESLSLLLALITDKIAVPMLLEKSTDKRYALILIEQLDILFALPVNQVDVEIEKDDIKLVKLSVTYEEGTIPIGTDLMQRPLEEIQRDLLMLHLNSLLQLSNKYFSIISKEQALEYKIKNNSLDKRIQEVADIDNNTYLILNIGDSLYLCPSLNLSQNVFMLFLGRIDNKLITETIDIGKEVEEELYSKLQLNIKEIEKHNKDNQEKSATGINTLAKASLYTTI